MGKSCQTKSSKLQKDCTHHNQMGFISGIQGRTNIQNSINMNGWPKDSTVGRF